MYIIILAAMDAKVVNCAKGGGDCGGAGEGDHDEHCENPV